jgi:YidC/Oxa1 family membrane protein insertase
VFILANIFQPLITVFESVLKFFHNSIGVPWGWSIVLLTVVVRAVLVPLTVKQYHSMQRLQSHMPELKALQARYKDDKQRQQQEMMKFYKENQINPFGSCLPLAAQIPVFISLFYMLRSTLRKDICPATQLAYQHAHLINGVPTAQTTPCGPHNGAGFLFISDLTNHATGITLAVLIVLYVGTQLASTLLMSTPTMERNQRLLMLFLPLFFVLFIVNFPAGVIVYWITTNSWTILQQYIIRKRIGPPPVAPATGSAGGGGGSGRDGGGNGAGGGGLAGILRGVSRGAQPAEKAKSPKQPAGVSAGGGQRSGPPPPPPRKKKKRSGRRR